MDASELRSKSTDQLQDTLISLKREAFNLRFQAATGAFENSARIRQVRRDIARVKTIINEGDRRNAPQAVSEA